MEKQDIDVTTDIVIFAYDGNKDTAVLLVKRKNPPFQGRWALPGGFVENNEPLDEAAKRELAEETGLNVKSVTQFYTYGDPFRDPRKRIISVAHYAVINRREEKHEIKAASDAQDAKWFSIHNLPGLAFDHLKIIRDAISKAL